MNFIEYEEVKEVDTGEAANKLLKEGWMGLRGKSDTGKERHKEIKQL
jgi:hypothetical protein